MLHLSFFLFEWLRMNHIVAYFNCQERDQVHVHLQPPVSNSKLLTEGSVNQYVCSRLTTRGSGVQIPMAEDQLLYKYVIPNSFQSIISYDKSQHEDGML